MARPGIMLYFDILEPIRVLPDAEKGRLLIAMLEYGRDGITPEFDGMLSLAWGFVRPKIDRDKENYDNQIMQKQFASFSREIKKRSLPPISFDEWKMLSVDERDRLISGDIERYPTTTTTATSTTAAATSTSTTTNTTASTAAAATGTTKEDLAAAAADRKLKVFAGDLGKGVVNLSEYQIDRLLDQLGIEMFDHYVSKLADFIIKNGATVKSHYSTILRWWTEDSSC